LITDIVTPCFERRYAIVLPLLRYFRCLPPHTLIRHYRRRFFFAISSPFFTPLRFRMRRPPIMLADGRQPLPRATSRHFLRCRRYATRMPHAAYATYYDVDTLLRCC